MNDAAIAETLTPRDHPFAAKRPPIDTDYFETYNRANVSLVDVRADPIAAITPPGVRLSPGPSTRSTSSSSPRASTR